MSSTSFNIILRAGLVFGIVLSASQVCISYSVLTHEGDRRSAVDGPHHYVADNAGHPAVNRAVAQEYPKLSARYGDQVAYGEDPKAHIKTEFGFDVAQVAKHPYAPEAYHDFIGFKVSKPLLERAFQETYGLELKDIFLSLDLALGTYRRAVSKIIPEMTRVALLSKRADIVRETPNF